MKTQLIDFIPFYGVRTYSRRLEKTRRSITMEEQWTDQALMIYHAFVTIILIEIVIETAENYFK